MYDNEKGKQQTFPQKKVKVMVAKNRLFVNLPITKSMVRLHEVIAFNDKHIFTYYFGETDKLPSETVTYYQCGEKDYFEEE